MSTARESGPKRGTGLCPCRIEEMGKNGWQDWSYGEGFRWLFQYNGDCTTSVGGDADLVCTSLGARPVRSAWYKRELNPRTLLRVRRSRQEWKRRNVVVIHPKEEADGGGRSSCKNKEGAGEESQTERGGNTAVAGC